MKTLTLIALLYVLFPLRLTAQDDEDTYTHHIGISASPYEGNPFTISYTFLKKMTVLQSEQAAFFDNETERYQWPMYLGIHARLNAFSYDNTIGRSPYYSTPNLPYIEFYEQTRGINIKTGINLITSVKRLHIWQWTQLLSLTIARHRLDRTVTDIAGSATTKREAYLLHPGFESEFSYHCCIIGSLYGGLSLCGGVKPYKISLFDDLLPQYKVLNTYAPAQGWGNNWFYMMPGINLKIFL